MNTNQCVTIYSKSGCGFCTAAKHLLESWDVPYIELRLGEDFTREQLLALAPDARTFPQIFVGDRNIGGYNELVMFGRALVESMLEESASGKQLLTESEK